MTDRSATVAVLDLLDAERAALLARVARVPDELRARRPAPGHWSAAEVLEHLARVEGSVVKLLTLRGRERPAEPAPDVALAQLTPERAARLRNRNERIEAPERVRPVGDVAPDEALRRLAEVRAALRAAYLAADPVALDGQTHTHPFIGTLTLGAWVEFLVHHEARHAAQIEAIADALGAAG
jgi:uncharacterized damage-inducible protein DinB